MGTGNFDYKIVTSIGGRSEQQDFAGSALTEYGLALVVCDGMGGARGGAIASRTAVEMVLESLKTKDYDSPSTALVQTITQANTALFRKAQSGVELQGMGTTIALLLLKKDKALVAHVGDSRVYQFRLNRHGNIQKIFRTDDHSKVFEMVKRGILSEEEARISEDSNIILRALGLQLEVDVEIHELPYSMGDRFLICSDGVSGEVSEQDLMKLIDFKKPVESNVKELIKTIDDRGKEAGAGHDNLTAILVEIQSDSRFRPQKNGKKKWLFGGLLLLLVLSFVGIGCDWFGEPSFFNGKKSHETPEEIIRQKTADSLKSIRRFDSLKRMDEQIQKPKNELKE